MSTETASGVTVVTHPLVQHKLSYLRDKDTPTVHFRKLANELTLLLTYEATKDFPTEPDEIETPLERMEVRRIAGKKVAVCPVLRAGLGMLDGVLSLVSSARVGFIGLYRDEETLQPVEYYVKLPELGDGERRDLARALQIVLRKLDGLWQKPMPYILAVHQAPVRGEHPYAHAHIEIYPWLRMPGRLKYLAGSEIGAGAFTADTYPEDKAAELGNVEVAID